MATLRTASQRALAEARRYVADAAGRERIRSELSREAFFRLAGRFTPTVEAEWPSGRFILSTADRDVSRVTFMSGPFALSTLHLAARLIGEYTGTTIAGRDVIEVGANIGTTTIPMITDLNARRVHAFEPSPKNYRLLRQTVVANGLDERIVTYPMALSDADGDVPFVASERNAGDSHVATVASASNLIVRAATLDGVAARGGWDMTSIAMAWIDVQGHEAAVLAGAERVIAGIPVVIEYWPIRLAETGTLELLNQIIAARFTRMIDLSGDHKPVSTSGVSELADGYREGAGFGDRCTDLLLLPG